MKHTRNTIADGDVWRDKPALRSVNDILQPSTNGTAVTAASLPPALSNAPQQGSIHASTLSFGNMGQYGDLLPRYLAARKEVFIDRLQWKIPHVDGMEFDQYDTPMCRWIILHEFGEVLGGARLLPTTAKCGTYTYMMRDGQRGLLEDFPTDILFFEAPVSSFVWEASRFFIVDGVPARRRSLVQYLLMRRMILSAADMGARHVVGIVPAVWARWARRIGFYAAPVGPRFVIGEMASQAVLYNTADQIEWLQRNPVPQVP